MRITKKYLKRIIREETRRLAEDHVDTELDNLKKNIGDDLDHIKDLKDDIKDDHEEEERAHEEELEHEKEKHESRRYRTKRLGYNQLRRMIREEHEDWGMGAGEQSHTHPGEEDYTGHKGDLSKTHPGEEDFEGDDVETKAHTAMAAIQDLVSAAGVELEPEPPAPEVAPPGIALESRLRQRRALKRRLARTIKETLRRRR